MSSFATLSASTAYLTLLQQINDRDADLSKALDPATTSLTTPLTGMVRFNSANKRWETYSGTAWGETIVAAADAYNITVTGLRGGNIYGTVTNNGTISGGTVNAAALQVAGSAAWTAASLTKVSQLSNDAAYITAAALNPYATLVSPTLIGTPSAPTAAVDTNTTQLASTQFVLNQGYLKTASATTTYAPLNGSGASGNWNITSSSCSGNAASATTAGSCSGNAASATTAGSCSGNAASATTAGSCSGNAASATTAGSCSGNAASATTAGSCSGNAASASTVAWANVSAHPTALSAFSNDSTMGAGQTWANVLSGRASGTQYTNSTGRPIEMSLVMNINSGANVTISGVTVLSMPGNNLTVNYSCIVPIGALYTVTSASGISVWAELR